MLDEKGSEEEIMNNFTEEVKRFIKGIYIYPLEGN
jgi:hypothetical protein